MSVPRGPCPLHVLKDAWVQGVIDENTLVWGHGLYDWLPAKNVKLLLPMIRTPEGARCAQPLLLRCACCRCVAGLLAPRLGADACGRPALASAGRHPPNYNNQTPNNTIKQSNHPQTIKSNKQSASARGSSAPSRSSRRSSASATAARTRATRSAARRRSTACGDATLGSLARADLGAVGWCPLGSAAKLLC